MDLLTALKFKDKHICQSPATEVAHFDLLSLEPSLDHFTGDLEIDIDIMKQETQTSPKKSAADGSTSSEHQQLTNALDINDAANTGHTNHYVVVLDLRDATKQAKVSTSFNCFWL